MLSKSFSSYVRHLNLLMLLGIVCGAALGMLNPELSASLGFVGEVFLKLLAMLIVPVIVVSMITGVLNLGDPESLGRVGLKALIYYTGTTAVAVVTGLVLVNLIQPGKFEANEETVLSQAFNESGKQVTAAESELTDVLLGIVPSNVVAAASDGKVLALIFFSIFFGLALAHTSHPGLEPIKKGLDCAFEAIMWMVDKIMLVAPFGLLSLVASLVGTFVKEGKLEALGGALAWYGFTVSAGLLFHGVVSLSLIAFFFKINPLRLISAVGGAVTTAFSTASSAATLPVTLNSLEEDAGVSNRIAGFVAPLGATVNMDGTAIYEAVAALFIANMYGVELSFSQQMIILSLIHI